MDLNRHIENNRLSQTTSSHAQQPPSVFKETVLDFFQSLVVHTIKITVINRTVIETLSTKSSRQRGRTCGSILFSFVSGNGNV